MIVSFGGGGVDMNNMEIMDSWIGIAIVLLLLVLIILWILLPYVVYLIQKRTDELVALNKSILSELKKLNQGVDSIGSEAPSLSISKCPSCGMENSIDVFECIKCGYQLPIVR